MTKTYFWLKLKDDFFKSREIKKLRKIAGGDTYTIIYLKLQLLSIKNDCKIEFEATEKDIYEQLSLELDEEIDNLKITISFLKANNLIEINENQNILVSSVFDKIGKECDSAERVRKYRLEHKNKETKMLPGNNIVTIGNTEIEIEKEIEKDIDKEEINKENEDKSSIIAKDSKNKLQKKEIQAFITRWNDFAERVDVPKIIKFDSKREKAFKNRVDEAGSLDNFMNIISKNWKYSSFLKGETSANFKFTIDFVLQKSSFLKIMEGNYIDKNKKD